MDACYASAVQRRGGPLTSGLAVSRSPQAEPDVATTPPMEKVEAASAVQGSVHQEDGGPAVATSGIATWYGGTDGFGPDDYDGGWLSLQPERPDDCRQQ